MGLLITLLVYSFIGDKGVYDLNGDYFLLVIITVFMVMIMI